MLRLLLGAASLCLVACTTETTKPVGDAPPRAEREVGAYLAQGEAAYRKSVVANPSYRLEITLDSAPGQFSGTTTIAFDYSGDGAPLTVDFSDGEVLAVSLDGRAIDHDYNGHFITLPAGILDRGRNTLRVEYRQHYSQDGSGLYHYTDPQDGRVYLYTDFQPFDANRVFPHFDQPDLKARFTLSVNAPADWVVVSTTRENKVRSSGDRRLWSFPATPVMSSYIFSLHAGHYAVFEDTTFRYPLRIFARQSMAEYVPVDTWFKLTRQGFDFFDAYFALPYPFGKYDQLMVPDYNSGAMENIAAVTFSETFLSRGEATRRERLNFANVIMHEMAHMWFGDITTMAWWNGLWLNESFATYMAELALHNATEFTENWQEFFLGMKNWAYWEDQLVTTHPIELPVPTTDDAFTNFDGITYGKGASVLKQLGALLGADVFRQGVRDYLQAHAWGNTELGDFMGAMESASGRDLGGWTRNWLYRAGVNTVTVKFECDRDVVADMQLVQSTPAAYPTLRQQRTRVALFSLKDGKLERTDTLDVLYEGRRTLVSEALGKACPDFAYPNYEDLAYTLVTLNERSLETAKDYINVLDDPMLRTMVWYDLFSMVENGVLPLTRYLDIVARHLPGETDNVTAANLFNNLRTGFSWLHTIPGADPVRKQYAARFETLLWDMVERASGDRRKQALAVYIDIASNRAAWDRLAGLLSGNRPLGDYSLDQDQRWAIVKKLSEFRYPGYEAMIAAEAARDPTSIGAENEIEARVRAARGVEKWAWYERMMAADENYTLQRSRTIHAGLFPYSSQRPLAAPFAEAMLERLPALSAAHDVTFHDRITAVTLPRLCTDDNVARLRYAARQYAGLNPAIVRGLKVQAQMDERCVKVGKLLGGL